MIIIFGSAGSGKSTQGEILAEKHGWKWVSSGRMFRSSGDAEIEAIINRGELVPDEIVNYMIFTILDEIITKDEKGGVVLDGYPRRIEQAKYLVQHNTKLYGQHNINLAVMIDVNKDEVLERMKLRGRDDDTPEEIEKRLSIYHAAIDPILEYFTEQNIPVVHINGVGSIEEIHERIETELIKQGII
ncbi:nucleoside monophosphate kinase [Candidatus Saccharibacteria bacterium]|nr:nucleoside monophosphate kinase [Candidatus Saccharibacteria bacterium]